VSAKESQKYDLGRQAREAGFPAAACNLDLMNPGRCWWLAGWHDLDFEKGNRVYKDGR